LPEWLGDLNARSERVAVLPADQAGRDIHQCGQAVRAREGEPHEHGRYTAPPGWWSSPIRFRICKAPRSACGPAAAAATSVRTKTAFRICSSTWRQGTARPHARQIAEEIEAVGATSMRRPASRTTAYYARVLAADVPLALDVLSDILTNPYLRAGGACAREERHRAGIGATEDTPDDLIFEISPGRHIPGPAVGRSILGTPDSVRSFDSRRLRGYLARNYRAPTWWWPLPARSTTGASSPSGAALRRAFPGPKDRCQSPRRSPAGARIEQRDLEQVHVAFALEGVPQRDPSIYSLQVFTNILGGGMSSRLFQKCARSAASATRSMPSMRLTPTPACSASMREPTRPICPS